MLLNNELFSCVFSTPLCLAGLSHILLMGQLIPLGSELFPGHGIKTRVQSDRACSASPFKFASETSSELEIQGRL